MAESKAYLRWRAAPAGGFAKTEAGNTFGFIAKLHPGRPAQTMSATNRLYHWSRFEKIGPAEAVRIQGFPDDFRFVESDGVYVCGMSVPPPMMQRVATEVAKMLDRNIKTPPLHTGPWTLRELRDGKLGSPRHGRTVFSCFHCGGGSTMGYKLAGYDVLGGVEIDPEMMSVYRENHRPSARFSFQMPIQDFNRLPDEAVPQELFSLDVLDGSPPCSSFSMAGSREDKWTEAHKFREGQARQVLDDLFFHFIETAARLRPRVVVAENVKGLIMGNARGYVKEIFAAFEKAGYEAQLFLLNASRMGVPQRRERTFFIARRRDLGLPALALSFSEPEIPVIKAFHGIDALGKEARLETRKWWDLCQPGKAFSSVHPKGHWFGSFKLHPGQVAPTQIASGGSSASFHWREPRYLSDAAQARLQGFPDDFDYGSTGAKYLCGMSVPPPMMQRVATEVFRQCLSRGGAS